MPNLVEYVLDHTERGECNCGECIDRGNRPDPTGHTIDLTLFKVAMRNNPHKETFIELARAHRGAFTQVDVFDGKEHSYLELSKWLGSQHTALLFAALGGLLGAFTTWGPEQVMPWVETPMKIEMARQGYITVIANK